MRYKIFLTLLIVMTCGYLLKPISVYAFWWFNQTKNVTPIEKIPTNDPNELSDKEKEAATAKYKIWSNSFDKKNIDSVIANKNNFTFSVPELNYIFESETKKAKNPIITNFRLTTSQDNLNITGDFHKIINGHFSFIAKSISVEKRARLELSYVKLYGIPIRANWLAEPLNKAIDEYFSFLYQDSRYDGFTFLNQNNILQLIPKFKNK